jgi:HD-GYP domain-containing protein (c-di-GMP phosphodiesterase class II)
VLNTATDSVAIERQLSDSTSGFDIAMDALDRFIHALQDGRQVPDQYRTALAAICEATGAQLAYLYSGQIAQVLEKAGDQNPTPQWCRDFCHKLAAELPRGGLWEAPEQESISQEHGGPEPCGAVVLPVEAPRPAWLVAVSFDRTLPIKASDLRVVRVIWQLQIGHNRHALVFDNLKETLFGIVRCLSTAIDAKDSFTCGHSERVARIAVRLGEEMKLTRGEISDLYLAGLLHDVGKIGIRDEVLLKEGPLTPEEYDHIKEHTILGDRIVSNVTRLAYLRPGVRGHHERIDGKGYPDGLAGDAIPQMARILAVADSCDAMMSARRYRPAIAPARIEQIMREGSGTQWDPQIVEVFFACRKDLYTVCQRGLGQSVYMAVERAAGGDAARSIIKARLPSDP